MIPSNTKTACAVLVWASMMSASVVCHGQTSGKNRFDTLGSHGVAEDGQRKLADFESDAYGPLPFPETVHHFIDNEIGLLLDRQREDGSFELVGRKTEAGGTVESIIVASMCGVSLRKHVERDPKRIEPSIGRALGYVIHMVRAGKLRTNVTDAAWRYTYALRFLVHEYPFVKDPKTRALVEDACALLLYELEDMQQGTRSQKATPVRWAMRSPPGMRIADDDTTGRARIAECLPDSPAHKAGLREGDILNAANGASVATTLRYYIAAMSWGGGDTVAFDIQRDGEPQRFTVHLPHVYPGVLGLSLRDHPDGGATVAAFDALSNARQAAINRSDRIVRIDGKAVDDAGAVRAMTFHSGQTVRLELQRDGEPVNAELICVPVPAADFGIEIRPGIDQSTTPGLEIQKMSRDSCLAEAGVKIGDRLLRIDDTRIMNRRHFQQLERTLWSGKPVVVAYLKGAEHKEVAVRVTAGASRHQDSLKKGHHGLTLAGIRGKKEVTIKTALDESPAVIAGCRVGDRVVRINGLPVTGLTDAHVLFESYAGQRIVMELQRDGKPLTATWTATRLSESPWVSGKVSRSGGWVYYKYVRGGTTFLTSDLMRILINARRTLPLRIPDRMFTGPFRVLSDLRMTQPNSNVESYRYDAGGSFWNVRDIRGDVGRLPAAELACLIYCDTNLKHDADHKRTQEHLAKALAEWLKHRAILDLAKKGGHGKFSIAPWYWPYSYWTTLEAAAYLKTDDELKRQVQETSLKAYFRYVEYKHIEPLGTKGYAIGYYPSKQLLRVCLMLDGLATVKHLYGHRVNVQHPALNDAMAAFRDARYGAASTALDKIEKQDTPLPPELAKAIETVRAAISKRFDHRLADVKQIHPTFPADSLRHLQNMKKPFNNFPRLSEVNALESDWADKPNAPTE